MKWLSDLSAVRDRVRKLLAAGFVEEPETSVLRREFIRTTEGRSSDDWIVEAPNKRRNRTTNETAPHAAAGDHLGGSRQGPGGAG
jgi:hypothetical protein